MIIIKLKGGLGNQMFQYAFARRLALETGEKVKLDTTTGFSNDFFEREFNLNNFNITLEAVSQEELKEHFYFSESIPGRVNDKLAKYLSHNNGYEVREKEEFTFDEEMINNSKSKYYDGYWQNPGYFNPIRNLLVNEFELKERNNKLLQLEEKIKNCNSVGIHIRTPHAFKGDEIDIKALDKYEILTEEYYSKAVGYIRNLYPNASFYVFAEDFAYARKYLEGIINYKIICGNDFEDLYLFSKCRHQIIANSTFSWWGAWLNRSRDKKVISPRFWFKDHSVPIDFLLDGFIRI